MARIELLQPYQYEAFRQWRANGDAFILERIRQNIELHEQGQIQMLVAVDDGQLVGTVQLAFNHPDTANDPKTGYVQALEIHPQHRRKGLGKALMEALERQAKAAGLERLILKVEPNNHPAVELYKATGWRKFMDSSWTWKGVEYPTDYLEKFI